MPPDEKIELWCCGRCAHEFFAVSSECPKCRFASYRLLNIISPAQVAVGPFRIARAKKKHGFIPDAFGFSKSDVYIALAGNDARIER